MTTEPQDSNPPNGGRPESDEILAGEYVLGVLSLEARRRIETRMVSDQPFARLVARWQSNMASFNGEYQEQQPSVTIFQAIERRLFVENQKVEVRHGLWNAIGFWRGLSCVTSAVAAAAIFYIAAAQFTQAPTDANGVVAELSAPNDPVALRVSFNPTDGRLRIIPVADQSAEKSLQLWLVPGSGAPTSLGVFEAGADGELLIPAELRSRIGQGATLAVSVEPRGGSPTGLPTGPVIASGSARNM